MRGFFNHTLALTSESLASGYFVDRAIEDAECLPQALGWYDEFLMVGCYLTRCRRVAGFSEPVPRIRSASFSQL
jgi:hypothetical protein